VQWEEVSDLAAVASDVDVLYQTRIQKERFLDRLDDYAAARGKFIIDAPLLKLMKPSAVIMHPLPRVDEVRTSVRSSSDRVRMPRLVQQMQKVLF
jgi:aspartate carbamoyltransferase catalytic subunit